MTNFSLLGAWSQGPDWAASSLVSCANPYSTLPIIKGSSYRGCHSGMFINYALLQHQDYRRLSLWVPGQAQVPPTTRTTTSTSASPSTTSPTTTSNSRSTRSARRDTPPSSGCRTQGIIERKAAYGSLQRRSSTKSAKLHCSDCNVEPSEYLCLISIILLLNIVWHLVPSTVSLSGFP